MKCPRCHKGAVLKSHQINKVRDHCPKRGLKFSTEPTIQALCMFVVAIMVEVYVLILIFGLETVPLNIFGLIVAALFVLMKYE